MKKQFKSSKKLLFEMVEKLEPGYNISENNGNYKIYGSYKNHEPEIIDSADNAEDANRLANEYQMAYKDDYTIWIAPLSTLNEEEHRPISQIAQEIYADWGNVSPYADAYLQPMLSLNSINDKYGMDSADSIIRYFLSNAAPWRGEKAREIKMELKKMVGLKEGVNLWEEEKEEKWMQGAVKKPGALHKELGVPEDETIPMSTINDKLADLRAKGRGEKTLSPKELKTLQRLNFAKNAKKSQNEAMDWDKVISDNLVKYRKMADDIKEKIDWIYDDEDWDSLESLFQLLRVGRNKVPIGVNENQMPSIGQKVEKIKAGVDFMFNEKNYNAIEAIYEISMKLFNQKSPELNEKKII